MKVGMRICTQMVKEKRRRGREGGERKREGGGKKEKGEKRKRRGEKKKEKRGKKKEKREKEKKKGERKKGSFLEATELQSRGCAAPAPAGPRSGHKVQRVLRLRLNRTSGPAERWGGARRAIFRKTSFFDDFSFSGRLGPASPTMPAQANVSQSKKTRKSEIESSVRSP